MSRRAHAGRAPAEAVGAAAAREAIRGDGAVAPPARRTAVGEGAATAGAELEAGASGGGGEEAEAMARRDPLRWEEEAAAGDWVERGP